MRIDILTLFPDLCDRVLSESVIGRARQNGIIEVNCHNIRDYTTDKHRRVDDYPYGGGKGMILQADPIYRCYEAIREETGGKPHLIYLSPQGKTLTQQKARELAALPNLALLCGHYEGIDERVIEEIVDEELSIGDYVLTGGELPALVVADCVARMLPGVLADEVCFTEESHFAGLLEYPQYSRPAEWHGRAVPQVLLNGDHKKVDAWRAEQALRRTQEKRPDLLKKEHF
ncbi:MAG: tRNA (guanosine(37)-N1)-methyltransferase TrmD [Firmicutes bacterium]|nr:tRNA (guanosine(37)-N1)-methyltransferase TrmD [Bacillota bacterium]